MRDRVMTTNGTNELTGRVFLVRHGRTPLNADGRLRGRLDPPLDEVGEREVVALARELATRRIVRILASPLTRAMQTAQAIGEATWLPVSPRGGLLDRDYGEWAGVSESEVVQRFGSVDAAPGVEPIESVIERARDVLEQQREVLERGDVVLVTHDAVLKSLLRTLDPQLAPDLRQRTACWNEIRPTTDGWQVVAVDQVANLSPAEDASR